MEGRKCYYNMILPLLLAVLVLPHVTWSQIRDSEDPTAYASGTTPTSPCPTVLTYEARTPGAGKWFAIIHLSTSVKLVGFTLDIKLDKPADILGNWVGEVETEDNTRFSITSTTKKINPGPALPLRIFVKYGSNPVPSIVMIKLNGRKICMPTAGTTRPPVRQPPTTPSTTTQRTTTYRATVTTVRRPVGLSNTGSKPIAGPVATTRKPASSTGSTPGVECGRIAVQPQALITHGQGTERGQYPWHVAMYQNKGKDLNYICGGSLIGRKAVLTAAHCVTVRPADRPVDPDTLVLYFGKYHLLLWSDGGVQNKQVQQVIVHPSYNSTNFRGDLAILTLKSPVEYNQFVKPVCLWSSTKTDLSEVIGKEGTVVGWGFDETGQVSQELMMAKMPVVSQETCIWSHSEFFSYFTNNMTYCAGFRNGTSVCNGDSGGGMYFSVRQADNLNSWVLRGLVSLSPSKQDERVCDTSHYVVFTDLAKYSSWITPYSNLK